MNHSPTHAFYFLALLRLLTLSFDYNYQWPDEHWQGPEIAYKIANGYGFESWEWTMEQPIRSPLYQLYLAVAYWLGNLLSLSPSGKEYCLRLAQVLLGMVSDWVVLKVGEKYFGKISFTCGSVLLTNWFYFSLMNRTYINSLQTCLTLLAFYFWTRRREGNHFDLLSRVVVGIGFMARTTSIIFWAVVWPVELVCLKNNRVRFLVKNMVQIAVMMGASIATNSLWYGKLTLVEVNFLKYNILKGWSELYGTHSPLYYFYFSLPFILAPYLLPLLLSISTIINPNQQKQKVDKQEKDEEGKEKEGKQEKEKKQEDKVEKVDKQEKRGEIGDIKQLLMIVVVVMGILSVPAHKQSRFLLVLLPFILLLLLPGLRRLQTNRILICFLLILNLSFFFVFTAYGKSGGVAVLRTIRQDIALKHPNNLQSIAVIYLCEPHSLPLYSILQHNVTTRLLDTSPLRKLANFEEEAELGSNAEALYKELSEGMESKEIVYLIMQEKYGIAGNHLSEHYQFLLREHFAIISSHRNVNLWEEYSAGWDGFVLFKKERSS